jgi:hypothetical protein
MVRKADRYTLTGGAGAGSRTSVIVFSAAQPHRLGVLVVASHVLYSRGKVSRRPWSLTGYPEPSKPLVRAPVSGERASTCRSGIESPAYPRLQLIHSAVLRDGVAAERNSGRVSCVARPTPSLPPRPPRWDGPTSSRWAPLSMPSSPRGKVPSP